MASSSSQNLQLATMAATPVSVEEISRRSYEQKYLIEDKITTSLVEVINQGIREQVSHGLLVYDFCVPSFIYGFPKFDVKYVAQKLRRLYSAKGFDVTGSGLQVKIQWTPKNPCVQREKAKAATTKTFGLK